MSKISVDVLETRDGTKTVNVADLDTALSAHEAAADPHPQYTTEQLSASRQIKIPRS